MYRTIGDIFAYDLFNILAIVMPFLTGFFLVKAKSDSLGLWSQKIAYIIMRHDLKYETISMYSLAFIEVVIMVFSGMLATAFNIPMAKITETGYYNYFGGLFVFPIIWTIVSIILVANPLDNIDIITIILPVHLFFSKLACFCNGCCWGIEWKYGLYNHHYDHPGCQVPVQAIEAFWAVLILLILLAIRNKAKPGTLLPIYMILYSATRFCSEFLRREENVFLIFKTYHILCVLGVVSGIILLCIVNKYRDRIDEYYYKKYEEI